LPEHPGLIRKRSTVHGDGVFAARPFRAGEEAIKVVGRIISKEEAHDDVRCLQIGPETYLAEIDGQEDLDSFINHSCEPNVGFSEGDLTLRALRDIAAGEELFWDYSTSINEPGWEVECRCGAKGCRGKIQSFCDLAPEHKRRLRKIALAYLR
jgi:SET domain-containing protein